MSKIRNMSKIRVRSVTAEDNGVLAKAVEDFIEVINDHPEMEYITTSFTHAMAYRIDAIYKGSPEVDSSRVERYTAFIHYKEN